MLLVEKQRLHAPVTKRHFLCSVISFSIKNHSLAMARRIIGGRWRLRGVKERSTTSMALSLSLVSTTANRHPPSFRAGYAPRKLIICFNRGDARTPNHTELD